MRGSLMGYGSVQSAQRHSSETMGCNCKARSRWRLACSYLYVQWAQQKTFPGAASVVYETPKRSEPSHVAQATLVCMAVTSKIIQPALRRLGGGHWRIEDKKYVSLGTSRFYAWTDNKVLMSGRCRSSRNMKPAAAASQLACKRAAASLAEHGQRRDRWLYPTGEGRGVKGTIAL
jgi:hypothetical protein